MKLFKPKISHALFLLVAFSSISMSESRAQDHLLSKGMTAHFIETNGIKMHYVKAGEGPKLVVMAHGFPEFWYGNFNILESFIGSKEYTAVAPDMRGYNLTEKPGEIKDYQVKNMVDDLIGLAKGLGYDKFNLIGHDWGGIVCWWLAIVHPDVLEKFIIINSPHPIVFVREMRENPAQQAGNTYTQMFRAEGSEAKLTANDFEILITMMMSEGLKSGVFTEKDKKIYRDAWSRPGALTGGLNWYRASSQYGPGYDLKDFSVNVPTLVIWGMDDEFILSSNLNGLDGFVPDLTIKEVEGASHWIIHETPELVNRYIMEFLAGG
jgi:pimeloyl-ACP methyl ester carboxylesterase